MGKRNMSEYDYDTYLALDKNEARKHGFAGFNSGKHLLVNIPDGQFTVSCRLTNGKRVTFAFCPYELNGVPQCVDIQFHDSGQFVQNGDVQCPIQQVIAFTAGSAKFVSKLEDKVTLVTLLLKEIANDI
jgi:hypothetical protein